MTGRAAGEVEAAPVARFTWREYGAEFLGTAIMLFVGLSAVSVNFGVGSPVLAWIPSFRLRLALTAVLFAGGGTAVVYSPLGRRSGAHLNPAVTLAFLLEGKLTMAAGLRYVLAQFLGAAVAATAVLGSWGQCAVSVRAGMTAIRSDVSLGRAAVLEFSMTAALVLLILTMLSSRRAAPSTGVAAGLLVALFVFVEAPLTGTSLNPARSFGPALAMGDFGQYPFYLVVPLLGAATAVGLYRLWGRFLRPGAAPLCGKLHHPEGGAPCPFAGCRYRPGAVFRANPGGSRPEPESVARHVS